MDCELDTQSSISSIDIDEKGKYLIAGGREILKLIDLDLNASLNKKKMNIKLNLRRQGTKLAIGYVEFNHYGNQNLLLAASVQGNFQIWDIEKPSEIFNRKDHTQAIHRMNWQNENCFISGGQDYQIFFYNLKQQNIIFSLTRNDAIRDIKFNINDKNYFMAATDSGLLEYFDMRNLKGCVTEAEAKCWKQNSSTNLIICLDWTNQNVFASGSNDKEIKIWQVENHTEIREKAVIQHIDGSSHIKWHKQNPSLLSVSSLNRDISVTTYDIRTPYRPIQLLKGHSDIITSFVYNSDESYIVTGSKDKFLRMQPVTNAFQVYNNCPIFPVAFNQYNDLIMKLESPNSVFAEFEKPQQSYSISSQSLFKQSSVEDQMSKAKTFVQSPQQQSYPDIKKATTEGGLLQQKIGSNRAIFYIEAIDQKFDEKIPFDVELDYLQKNYHSKKDFLSNSNVALQISKPEIAHYWKALDHLINDLSKLTKEFSRVSMKDCPIQTLSSHVDLSDDDQKSSPLEISLQPTKSKQQDRRTVNQLDWQDIQKLYKYFEKYPAAFKQELDSKNIIIEDQNHLKIHIERIPYYKALLRTMTPLGQLLTDKQQMMKVISNSILSLIQYVIDLGELPSGFWMAACAKNFVIFPEMIATKWTKSYIDLLVSFGKPSYAMKVALESPVESLRNSNKNYLTNYKCLGQCKNNQTTGPSCHICKIDFSCAICFQPVKGLYLWCQHCMHGGHMKEMKLWFNKNTQCPLGCGHTCFEK